MDHDQPDRPKKNVIFTNAHFYEGTIPKLTRKEKTIAKAMLVHFNTKKAARELGISPETVRKYCSALRLKFNEDSTVGAIYKAKKLGLLN